MYFDEEEGESNEVKLDDENGSGDSEEEMHRRDDSDDGYGGYNEYGERDRSYYYYYRDGGYERKTSPMMSPIISPVTA